MPNIKWINNSISNNAYPLSLCNFLLDTFHTFGFHQLVTFPTRRHNTLDIFATNQPFLVEKYEPILGIGDHKSVLIELLLLAKYIPLHSGQYICGLKLITPTYPTL